MIEVKYFNSSNMEIIELLIGHYNADFNYHSEFMPSTDCQRTWKFRI